MHGEKSLAFSQVVDFSRLLAVYCVAEARELTGDSDGAELLVAEQNDAIPTHLPMHLLQTWLTFKADIAWIAGRRDRARDIGHQAIVTAADEPLDRSNVGALSRWAAILLADGQRYTSQTIGRIREVRGMTWWDEAERLRGLVAMESDSEKAAAYRAALNDATARLPLGFYSIARYSLAT